MSNMRGVENLPRTVQLVSVDGHAVFRYIDQRKLPAKLVNRETADWREVVDAIASLAVRGAPAIGIAGAASLALWAQENVGVDQEAYAHDMKSAACEISSCRPTAVNLSWAVNAALREAGCALSDGASNTAVAALLVAFVQRLAEEDECANRAIGSHGAALLDANSRILTHCNAGSLATSFYGTALGVVYAADAQGKIAHVFADETRPVGQGARLTTWELCQAGIPVTLICDDMAASLMAQGNIDAVVVGADRIARNGDTANKIGTYGVAILAQHHGIPFYVAAPFSSIDGTIENGDMIEIEERDPAEVLPEPIEGVDVWNPAFDVTPSSLITKIITEKGAFAPSELVERL